MTSTCNRHVAETRILRRMCGVTRMDNIRNNFIRSLKETTLTEKIKWSRLSCHGQVIRRNDTHVTKGVMGINVVIWFFIPNAHS